MDYPESIAASVGIVSVVAGVVTLVKGKASKPVMDFPPGALGKVQESMDKLLGLYNDMRLTVSDIRKDSEHAAERMEAMEARLEKDHAEIKKLSLILYPLLKREIDEDRRKMGLDPAP